MREYGRKYRLKKDLPLMGKGIIFENREYDRNFPDRGNPGTGCMINIYINGNCQSSTTKSGEEHTWCGETYILPGQTADDREWFEPLEMSAREKILKQIDDLQKQLKNL